MVPPFWKDTRWLRDQQVLLWRRATNDWRNEEKYLCCPQNRMFRNKRDLSGNQGRNWTRTDLEEKKSTSKEPCLRFYSEVSQLPWFLSVFQIYSPHISDYWQLMYIFYCIRLFMQFSKVVKFSWYTSKVKFAFLACLWVCRPPLLVLWQVKHTQVQKRDLSYKVFLLSFKTATLCYP